MTYRDDEYSAAPNPPHAMIGAGHPRDALVVQSNNGALATPIYTSPNAMPTSDVLRGGMDVDSFVNCLRRRWLLAICMGVVMSASTAGLLWFLFPESSSAIALFSVSSKQPTLFTPSGGMELREFEILQRTQMAYLKSRYVMEFALRDSGIASLGILAGESDPVQWLIENLDVSFAQNSEILSIALSGDTNQQEDLRKLVDAVADAYKNQVVSVEDLRRDAIRDALAKGFKNISGEISSKMETYLDLGKELGTTTDSRQRDPESEMLMRDVVDSSKTLGELKAKAMQMQIDFIIMQQRYKNPALVDTMVDEKLADDPNYENLNNQLMQYQLQLSSQGVMKGGRSREADRIQKQISATQQSLAEYRQKMKAQIAGEQKGQANPELTQLTKEYQIAAGSIAQQMQQLEKTITENKEKLLQKGVRSTELEIQRAELEQLQEIAKDMSIKLESLDVEASAPARIRLIQPATLTPGINSNTRYGIVGLGAVSMFALTCFGIAYLEFRNRRLNGPSQMDEGLGIRVVGTLPSLSSRSALDPDHPIVAQLTESIDNVRTQLMHDSSSKRRQVVMVTSATTKEGRTTVASQLAASLARAGRRTLLVDGDVRSAYLHAMFDVPLEDGLCEVLRAEVDVSDVIRPTHAEGLWLLTAGYCDMNAIHALATEQMQPVFDKLRAEYDFIIIDGAPVLGMSDALIFGQYCDGAILTVRRDYSQMPKINEAACLLQSVGVRMIGCVVNGVPTKSDDRVTQLRLTAPKSERELQPA